MKNLSKIVILPVFIVITLLLISTSLTEFAYAAKKIEENKGKNNFIGITSKCDRSRISGEINFHTIIWDNGRFNTHFTFHGFLSDLTTGEIKGTFTRTINEHGNSFELPIILLENEKITCNSSGIATNTQFFFMVHKDGSITFLR